jgi:hypothetical protein
MLHLLLVATVLLGKISPTRFLRYYFTHKPLLPITIFFQSLSLLTFNAATILVHTS